MTDNIADDIREDLDRDPETVVYASLDRRGSTAIFDVSDGNVDAELKAIGLLVAKVALQTDEPPERVATEAAWVARELMDDD